MDKPFVFSLKSPIDNKPFIIEEWRIIDNNVCEGATGTAEISNLGRVRKRSTHAIRKPYMTPFGYLRIAITVQNNRQKQCFIHQLVMRAFCPLLDYSSVEVNHIDGNKLNNRVENLEWCTQQENTLHAVKHNLIDFHTQKRIDASRNNGKGRSRKILLQNLITGEEKLFESIQDCSRYFGNKNNSTVASALRRGTILYKKYIVTYTD